MSQAPRRSRLKERSPHPLGLAHTYIRSGPRHTKYVTHAVVGPACLLRACLIFLTSVARPPATRRSLSAPTASSETESHSLVSALCAQSAEGRESRDATREVRLRGDERTCREHGARWRLEVESGVAADGGRRARRSASTRSLAIETRHTHTHQHTHKGDRPCLGLRSDQV